jgi:hypothetical protein
MHIDLDLDGDDGGSAYRRQALGQAGVTHEDDGVSIPSAVAVITLWRHGQPPLRWQDAPSVKKGATSQAA